MKVIAQTQTKFWIISGLQIGLSSPRKIGLGLGDNFQVQILDWWWIIAFGFTQALPRCCINSCNTILTRCFIANTSKGGYMPRFHSVQSRPRPRLTILWLPIFKIGCIKWPLVANDHWRLIHGCILRVNWFDIPLGIIWRI